MLRTLAQSFPNENFLYLGDTARLPYGTKSSHTIRQYVDQNIQFLTRRKVKAIVVACNSASSVLDRPHPSPIPIYDVIGPGSRTAYEASKNLRIGVIATRATVSQGAYVRAIEQLDPQAKVFQQACPLLVPLVEEGWIEDPLTRLIVYRYLNPMIHQSVDTLVLGCTHYPLLRSAIAKVMGPDVSLIDSGQAIAQELKSDMEIGKVSPRETGGGKIMILNTESDTHIRFTAESILAPLRIHSFTHVDIQSQSHLPTED